MNDYCKVRFSGESNDGTGEVPNTLPCGDNSLAGMSLAGLSPALWCKPKPHRIECFVEVG